MAVASVAIQHQVSQLSNYRNTAMTLTRIADREASLEQRIHLVNQHWTPEERDARRRLASRRFGDLVTELTGFPRRSNALKVTRVSSPTFVSLGS
jgi:hypothetical protein